jgi:hypothetical protein
MPKSSGRLQQPRLLLPFFRGAAAAAVLLLPLACWSGCMFSISKFLYA